MDKRQDSNVAYTPPETSGPLAQVRYCARRFGGGVKKRRGNRDKQRQVCESDYL